MQESVNEFRRSVDPSVRAARALLALRAEKALGVPAVKRKRSRKAMVASPASVAGRTNSIAARPMPIAAVVPIASVASPTIEFIQTSLLPAFDLTPIARSEKLGLLSELDESQVKGCTKCGLCRGRTNTVYAAGDCDARVMFIGEGPGEEEDMTGIPFVGRSGKLLDKMIGAMGLSRDGEASRDGEPSKSIYIANVVKCRPPENRQPSPQETAACSPYLMKQIEWVRPQVIVTLGLPATQLILGLKLPMGQMRGKWHAWRGIKVMPTYHPSYVLRSYNEQTRRAVWSDLQLVMIELGLEISGVSSSPA